MISPGLFSSYHIKFALNISLSVMLSEQQNPQKKEEQTSPCMDEEDPCRFAPYGAAHLKLYACAIADQCLADQPAFLA
jgi:hypothetical protein